MPDMTVSRPSKKPKVIETYEGRLTETYLLQQHEYNIGLETFQTRRVRLQENDALYRGAISELYPDETTLPTVLYIENKYKNSLHDHTRLAAEGKGMPRFIERGDREADKLGARVRESISDTYWVVGSGRTMSRQLYMDLYGTGSMALAGYYNGDSVYPQFDRLNPRYCYPDYRNGKLYSMVYIETMRERLAALRHPNIEGLDADAKNNAEVDFIAYYGKDEVAEAFVRRARDNTPASLYLVQRWIHNMGRVPVAYHQLTTYDGATRGIFDQLGGPMMVRNKAVRFAIDYMEQAAYSPLFALNIENATELPGPTTVYRGDPDAEPGTVHLERIGPATTGGTIWNLISYMGEQEEKEATQPASRSGQIPQSQASGSFVNSTQGTLTSVIIEGQEGMGDLREQLDVILMMIDEKWLDVAKPLIRPVQRKKTYTPTKDIDGWYFHTIEFGASAGLDKLNADNRVLNLVAGRIIDRGTAQEQVDFLSDSSSIQEKIDNENINDALLQRYATDPTTPFSSLLQVSVLMKRDGNSFIEALEKVAPEVIAAEQAAIQQANPNAGAPGEVPTEEGAPPAEGLPAEGVGETPVPKLPSAPMQQLFGNQGIRR